jgi:hypothetical protein
MVKRREGECGEEKQEKYKVMRSEDEDEDMVERTDKCGDTRRLSNFI